MRVCGLDVATHTGWCLADGDSYQTGRFDPGKPSCDAERNSRFRAWLYTFLRSNEVQYAAIEMQAVVSPMKKVRDPLSGQMINKVVSNDRTAKTLSYLNGCAQEVCFSLSIPFELVPVQTWRSAFAGKIAKGEDPKKAVRKVCELMHIEAKNDDAGDAAGIAFWLQTKLKQQRGQASAGPLFEGAL